MLVEYENPNKARAVKKTLTVVTVRVLNLRVSFSDNKLDTTVPLDMIIDIMPIADRSIPISECIIGHEAPNNESGSPRLINAR